MTTMKPRIPLLFVIMLVIRNSLSQVIIPPYVTGVSPDEIEKDLDMFVKLLMGCNRIAGMSVAILHKDDIITNGFGQLNLTTMEPATNESNFVIASLTKAFTATLLGTIISEQDNVTWDTRVKDVMPPDFAFYDELRTEHATIRDLLSHRMGIPSHNRLRMQSTLTRQTLYKKLRFLRPTEEFRGSYVYSNLMYGLAAHITEILGKKSWEELMVEKIFLPLGMTSTAFRGMVDIDSVEVAQPYVALPDGDLQMITQRLHTLWGVIGGSGSISTSAVDITRWLYAVLHDGKNPAGTQVIPEHVIQETLKPVNVIIESESRKASRNPADPHAPSFYGYGMGWRSGGYRGIPIVSHTGSSFGYISAITLIPNEEFAIFTAATGTDSNTHFRYNLHSRIIDVVTGQEHYTYDPEDMCGRLSLPSRYPESNSSISMPLPAEKYIGTYGNYAYGNITIKEQVNGPNLWVEYGEIARWELFPSGEGDNFTSRGRADFFIYNFKNIKFQNPDSEGNMQEMIWPFESRDPPVFHRDRLMSDAPPIEKPRTCQVSQANGQFSHVIFLLELTLIMLGISFV